MNITITLISEGIDDINQYYLLFEKLDKKGYKIEIEDNIIYIEQDINNIQKDIESILLFFLQNIDMEFLKRNAQKLRVGIFYSLNEIVFLSVDFSNNLIKVLSDYKLGIEMNSYLY